IYVLPYYHGSGAGGALLEAAMEVGKEAGAEYVWLNTVVENNRAIRFYHKHGFEKAGREHFTIGSQRFDYHIMSVAVTEEVCHC
ncbi:MAG TPA: GNAT family N-acetyltransferase, partial [Chitinophagaceae bacterium]